MEDTKRNLQESIVLHNLFISIYGRMIKEKDKAFFKFVRQHTRANYSETANAILNEVQVNLIKEIMVLLNQVWVENSDRFDARLIKEKTIYNAIKSQISNGDKFPFNNRELYKRIRESIAHNSKDIQNFTFNLYNFELNLGQVDGQDYIVHLDVNQMLNLFYVLFINMKSTNDPTRIIFNETDRPRSRQEINERIKIVNVYDQTVKNLDVNQVERFYNYFNYVEPNKDLEGNEQELQLVFAFENNAERVLFEKLRALKAISQMTSNSSFDNITYNSNKERIDIYMAIISNLFFNIASSLTNPELEELFSGCGVKLNKEKIRHLRNALCHGRYFHNFNDAFYFYDGRKVLDFKLKLTIQDFNKILDKIAKGGYSVVALS